MLEALPEMSTEYATALLKDFDEEIARAQEAIEAARQAPRRRGRQKTPPGVKNPSRIQQELASLAMTPALVGSRSRAPAGEFLASCVPCGLLSDNDVFVVPYQAGCATGLWGFHGNQHVDGFDQAAEHMDGFDEAADPDDVPLQRQRDPERVHTNSARALRQARQSRRADAVTVAAQEKLAAAEAFREEVKRNCDEEFSWDEVRLKAIEVYSCWNLVYEGKCMKARGAWLQ